MTASIGKIGLTGCIANLSKTAISSGLLLFPNIFRECGLLVALTYVIIVSACSHYAYMFLAYASLYTKAADFTQLTTRLFLPSSADSNKTTRQNAQSSDSKSASTKAVSLILNSFTPLIAFIKIAVASKAIAASLTVIIEACCNAAGGGYFVSGLNWYKRLEVAGKVGALILAVTLIFPLSLIKQMSKLAKVSFAGVAALLYIMLVVVGDSIKTMSSGQIRALTLGNADIECYFAACTMILCFAGHPSIPNIVSSMHDCSKRSLNLLSAITVSICAVLYGVTGLMGYLNGRLTPIPSPIVAVQASHPGAIWYHVGGAIISIVLCVTCPLLLFPARTALEKMFGPGLGGLTGLAAKQRLSIFNVLILLVSVAAGLNISTISQFTGFFGAIVGSGLVLILPSLCVLKLEAMYGGSGDKQSKEESVSLVKDKDSSGEVGVFRLSMVEKFFAYFSLFIGFAFLASSIPAFMILLHYPRK